MSNPLIIPIIFPNENIGPSIPFLGHGGFIMVDANGNATYFDYGLYDTTNSTDILTTAPAAAEISDH